MKVIVTVILALGSAAALGSGPYLPSGWRPQGPAFYLPSEVQKPADNPLKETLLFETEASGSDSLREYGPPKESAIQESLNVMQVLPDVVTDQAFYVVSALEQQVSEVNAEQNSEIQEATTEIIQVVEAVEGRAQDIGLESEVTTSYVTEKGETEFTDNAETTELVTDKAELSEAVTDKAEIAEEVTDKAEIVNAELVSEVKEIEATVEAVEEKLERVVQEEQKLEVVQTVEVKNIAETLVNLESEIKAEQVQSVQAAELKITQEGSGTAQVPEGFLEYGPPGFREYGPPKGDELQRSAVIAQDSNSFENNETRRRRFSPKFRSSKNKKH